MVSPPPEFEINKYINKYQNQLPTSVQIIPQEQILNFAYYNEFGANVSPIDLIPYKNANLLEIETTNNEGYIEDLNNIY